MSKALPRPQSNRLCGAKSLLSWIEEVGGPAEVAKLLGVQESTVRHWRRGFVLPSDETKLKILKLSRGTVTAESMLAGHFSPKNKTRYGRGRK